MSTIFNLLVAANTKIDPKSVGIEKVDANSVLVGVLDTVYFLAGIAAVIVIVIAGILYSTSNGDSAKVQKAKNAILYAIVGLVFVLSAFIITAFIIGRF